MRIQQINLSKFLSLFADNYFCSLCVVKKEFLCVFTCPIDDRGSDIFIFEKHFLAKKDLGQKNFHAYKQFHSNYNQFLINTTFILLKVYMATIFWPVGWEEGHLIWSICKFSLWIEQKYFLLWNWIPFVPIFFSSIYSSAIIICYNFWKPRNTFSACQSAGYQQN